MAVAFAAFAGWFAVDVWKEKTQRRASVVGLALPCILWGLLADVSGVAKSWPARAQISTEAPGRPGREPVEEPSVVTIVVVDKETGKPIDDARTAVARADNPTSPIAASSIGTSGSSPI